MKKPKKNCVYQENYELKQQVKEMKVAFREIAGHILCIGGPLNDSVLRYSREQLAPFQRILNISESFE